MKVFNYVKTGDRGYGLCNQLFSIINGIISAIYEHHHFVILSDFLPNYDDEINTCPVSDVIDLSSLNEYLKPWKITVIDHRYFNVSINSILYGNYFEHFDITGEMMEKYMTDEGLFIPQNIILNSIKGDPVYGVKKRLFIRYQIGNVEDLLIVDEKLPYDIHFILNKLERNRVHNWINRIDMPLFEDFLNHLRFDSKYYQISNNFIEQKNITNLNVFHLRNEKDAIPHWAYRNHMVDHQFEMILNHKYINLITKYFDKDIPIFVMTAEKNNFIIDFMKDNGYTIYLTEKNTLNGRELNGIVDLLVGKHCNNIFIGTVNPENFHGSTFSYYLMKRLPISVKKILIDLDDINREEFVLDA